MFTADTVQPQDAVRTPGRSVAPWGRGWLFPPVACPGHSCPVQVVGERVTWM